LLTNRKFQDAQELLQGSSEDEMYEAPITKTYDSIFQDGGDLLFPNSSPESTRDFHPSTVHAFRLWQTFVDNVNPLLKLFHAPTVQQQFLDGIGDLDNVPKATEALMFGIYCTSIMSLDETECVEIFGDLKTSLRMRYQAAARQALQKAGLFRSSDLTVLQAFILYLVRLFTKCTSKSACWAGQPGPYIPVAPLLILIFV
jgi:hypothetical protein